MAGLLEEWGDGVWRAPSHMRMMGLIREPLCMTVVRLPDSSLFLHSPVPPTDALVAEVAALGAVSAIVSPNALHHLSMGPWREACPDAQLYASPGLRAKRTDLVFHADLGDTPEPAWADVMDQTIVTGNRVIAAEVEFLHKPSGTLILTDLCFHYTADAPWEFRTFGHLQGIYGRLAMPRLLQFTMKDKAAFCAGVERILEWDFDKVIVSHGAPVASGGKDAFRAAMTPVVS